MWKRGLLMPIIYLTYKIGSHLVIAITFILVVINCTTTQISRSKILT